MTTTSNAPKIAVLGAGALGSVIGGLLADGGLDVTLINPWREHIDAINKTGLKVVTANGDMSVKVKAVANSAECGKMDIVIVLTKSYITEDATRQALNLFGRNTVAMSFQNGLGNEEAIQKVVGKGRVLGGQTSQGAAVLAPGVVRKAGHNPSFFGEMGGGISTRVKLIEKAFNDAGFYAIASADIRKDIWKKVLANLGTNPISAVCRIRVGQLFDTPEIKDMIFEIMKEGISVAQADGVDVNLEDGLELLHKVVYKEKDKAKSNRSSMLVDILEKRKTEIDYINGAIVNLGKKYDIPTPVNTTLVALVKGIEGGFEGQ
jgi:2-dehydropantoate 2-reductase